MTGGGISRRRFLGIAGGAAGAALAGTVAWSRLVDEQVQRSSDRRGRPSGRILVVLELAGGNDGLNSLVPAKGLYRDARPGLAIDEAHLVPLAGRTDHALHPALAPLAPIWADGHLAAVHGVGFDDQTRSHFVATDVWRAGGEAPFVTSWLGRWLDATGDAQPAPLRAIALGTDTRVLAARHALSTVVNSPSAFRLLTPVGTTDPAAVTAAFAATAAPISADPLRAAAQTAIPATIDAVDVLDRATPGAGGAPVAPALDARATGLLATAARIIELDIGTQVFVVGIDGFDTHANQADQHTRLLTDVGNGISSFLAEMDRQGRADDVLVLTTSEFGRRVDENGSAGTDHGRASVQFLAGSAVRGDVLGEPGLGRQVAGDLPIDVDTRSLYAIGLDWLGGPTDEILGGDYDRLGLLP